MKPLIANVVRLICFLFLSSLLAGCGRSTKSLVGGYALERFAENGKYYVTRTGGDSSGGGVFDGTVEEIGWNGNWIVARVEKLYRGDTNGWYALNVKTKQLIGPIQDSELRTNANFSTIKCHSCPDIIAGKTN